MSVKNYIAAFEAHNEVVRASPASSPGRVLMAREIVTGQDNIETEQFETDRRGSTRDPKASDHSATGLASHARRTRLQKELDIPNTPQSMDSSRGSLAERRKARQQRKQHLMQRRSSSKGPSEKRESRRTPPTSPKVRPNDRQQPESATYRRSVHSVSAEHDEGLETPNSFRAARRARRAVSANGLSRAGEYDYNDAQSDAVDATDDEATLTSVRQIMTIPMIQQPSEAREGMGHDTVLRTASSSSFEVDTRQDMYSQVPKSTSLLPPTRADDEETVDYADLNEDDDDNSATYESRKKRETQRRKNRKGYVETQEAHSPLVNKDDIEHYRKSLDTPVMKTAAFVVGAATVGTMLLGPVGLLLGAATVGIGVGIMQIPEEQRTHMKDKATKTLQQAHESALNASEALSNSCAASCQNSSVADQFPVEMKQCFTQEDVETNADHHSVIQNTAEHADNGANNGLSTGNTVEGNPHTSTIPSGRNRRVACLRDVRITPVDQIHGLPPQKQPRAWLDVLANANTTSDEKSEAMEEIKILARDKRHARILLDEGILDSLMYILNHFFEKVRRGLPIDAQERFQAKLAASCCVTLGKAHCAAVHTEGDLLLMSMYERGTVPEERQLAQMLYEVPHHVLSMEPDVFVLQQTSMSMAEELACSIKDLSTA